MMYSKHFKITCIWRGQKDIKNFLQKQTGMFCAEDHRKEKLFPFVTYITSSIQAYTVFISLQTLILYILYSSLYRHLHYIYAQASFTRYNII